MEALLGLLSSLAVVAVAGAGMAAIGGLPPLRDRLLGAAVTLVVASLAVRLVVGLLCSKLVPGGAGETARPSPAASSALVIPFAIGHVALAVALLRRRLGAAERGPDERAEIERARGRIRPRISAEGVEAEQ